MDYELVLSGGTDKVEGKVLECFQTATVGVDQIFKNQLLNLTQADQDVLRFAMCTPYIENIFRSK